MNGARILTETLRSAGVDVIFSLSGNQIMPVYDACLDSDIRIVHTRHENAAVYMANAYAQLTGRVGVALVTAAPGFANALSALYSAKLDEAPVLLLSGDSPIARDGQGSFQELDQLAMSAPVTKLSARPRSPDELGATVARALGEARAGRPGPVHIALAADLLMQEDGAIAPGPAAPDIRAPDPASLDRIAQALSQAERPLILTGPLLNRTRAGDLAQRLETAACAPVLCFESPRGLRDPALGRVGEALADADLVLGLGKPFDYTTGFAAHPAIAADATLISIDPDPEMLDRAEMAAAGRDLLTLHADAGAAAEALIAAATPVQRTDWCACVREQIAFRIDPEPAPGVDPRIVADAVNATLAQAREPILIADGGEFGQWMQALIDAPARIINGLSGEIGGGISHAIAAKIARPDSTVILVMGDGTAGFHLAEFETAAREGATFVAIVGNDSLWNAEYQIQLRDYGAARAMGCGLLERARYDRAAAALGCHGAQVECPEDMRPALEAALQADGPACIDVRIASLAAPDYRRGPGGI